MSEAVFGISISGVVGLFGMLWHIVEGQHKLDKKLDRVLAMLGLLEEDLDPEKLQTYRQILNVVREGMFVDKHGHITTRAARKGRENNG